MLGRNDLNYFINLAIKEAFKSCFVKRHGAIILDKKLNVIGKGYNKIYKFNSCNDRSMHAERMAIINSSKKKGYIMIVVRLPNLKKINKNNIKIGDCLLSKPCENCKKRILKKGINYIYYT